jgi:AcrR family transcriptional regulator
MNMCCATKVKIASTVRELMQTRPINKITVQDVMQRADMTRQSFYYHFQDIYDVLEWDVSNEMKVRLAFNGEQSFEDWCREILNGLSENQPLYRKMAEALGRTKIQEMALPYTRLQMKRLLYGTIKKFDDYSDDEQIALDFTSRTLVDSFLTLLFNRSHINTQECMHHLRAVVSILQSKDALHRSPSPQRASVAC